MMFGGTARRGLHAERRTFILLPSGERAVSSLHPTPSSPVAFVHFATCTLSTHAEGEATHEISHLRALRISRALGIPLHFPSSFVPVGSSPFRLATSQQPPALLLLSDYCAAVTAVCRFVCIRVIHFLRNISSCAT